MTARDISLPPLPDGVVYGSTQSDRLIARYGHKPQPKEGV